MLTVETALWITTRPTAILTFYYHLGSRYLIIAFQNIMSDIQPQDTLFLTDDWE